MLVVRAATESDLEGILHLARAIGPGMTTLKPDRDALRDRLAQAVASFAGTARPSAADYLFVLEDLARSQVCGVSAIKGAVGVSEPFYNYRIHTTVHARPDAGLVNRVQSLHLTHDLAGAAELCSLYLDPAYRKGYNGKLLSKARLLFLAQFPERFPGLVFAEMRGYQDAHGRSPFWDSVGRPFFHMDFHEADDLCGAGDRRFIEQLVPRLPLYTHLLGAEAQAAIGRTHEDTVPARRLLEQEGLHFDGYIDIFDGGPVLQAHADQLRARRESRVLAARAGAPLDARPWLVATARPERFRAMVAAVSVGAGAEVTLAPDALATLGCAPGAAVRLLSLAPAREAA